MLENEMFSYENERKNNDTVESLGIEDNEEIEVVRRLR
jgi:hypothetical protein